MYFWVTRQIQKFLAHCLCISGTKARVGHYATAAGQLWAEWEERHAAGWEEDTRRGDQALESSDPGQWIWLLVIRWRNTSAIRKVDCLVMTVYSSCFNIPHHWHNLFSNPFSIWWANKRIQTRRSPSVCTLRRRLISNAYCSSLRRTPNLKQRWPGEEL